jgi:transposase
MSAKLLLVPLPEIRVLKTVKDKGILIVTAAGSGERRCPDCGTVSTSHKGGYVRQLRDLPVQGIAVRLEVETRRWRCRNEQCERQSFVERLEKSAPSHARRTHRVSEVARLLGHATGGRAAERMLCRLGIPQSDDTVLRTVKRAAASRRRPVLRVATGICPCCPSSVLPRCGSVCCLEMPPDWLSLGLAGLARGAGSGGVQF